MKIAHKVKRFIQTSDTNCGPHALASLLSFYGNNTSPEKLERATEMICGIGTYDGYLGQTAITLGFKAQITPQNLYVFDPTWKKLEQQHLLAKIKEFGSNINGNLKICINGYAAFMENGGIIEFNILSKNLLVNKIKKWPLLVGVCSTYLQEWDRPNNQEMRYREGHFMVLNGYDQEKDLFTVIDPWPKPPLGKNGIYQVDTNKLLASMYLAEATYDCTILEIWQ